jgi:hypothetical protein
VAAIYAHSYHGSRDVTDIACDWYAWCDEQLQPAIAKMKVGLLQAKAEEEERKRCAATAQALVEGGNIGELDHVRMPLLGIDMRCC